MRLGIISDTHGLLRPEAMEALQGSEIILHAGDVGNFRILDALRSIAPVHAIRGNVDITGPCALLPETEMLACAGRTLYMVHSVYDLDIHPVAAAVNIVISGHSHKPSIKEQNGILFLNPGSAGPRRFSLPVTVAIITLGETFDAEILHLL